ncbi:MAG: DUF4062 domain-containing protein [Pseudomonadota bacterium]
MELIDRKKRSIRVFISSTFQDMQEERDLLIKEIFPKLRKMCMERGVGFTEVDLRWGVTQEQAEKGEVLPICLAEIENCRPFFIGLLGERYGWVPDSIPEGLIDEQPWLEQHRQYSVTELEIVHGVLNDPDMAGHAFFYFRDPSNSPAHFENQKEQDKQNQLKDRIRSSGFPVIENYPDVKTLGQSILKDLENSINKEFPEQTLTPLERDRLDHEVFAESRAKVYIGRPQYFDQLDDHALGTGQPLVVLGELGSGKSALLANWCFHFQEKYPDTFLLTHFIGISTDSTDYIAMLRRIMMEIKEQYTLENKIPDTPEGLRAQFPNWLSMAAAHGRFIFILDGLDQLEDKDNAMDLVWLPEFIPSEARLIVSTLPGQSLDALEKRDWSSMEVELLEIDERQQLITDYLREFYSKSLPPDQVDYISSQKQCANPLFLHALLEELRIFGKHEQVQARIEHLLQAKNPEKLYELILDRLEQDYEKDYPGLVGEALSLIWAARRGLSETELLEIMNLPRLTWSPLFLALHDSLVTRSGLSNFFHDYLRQAVQEKYISGSEAQQRLHLQLASYFNTKNNTQRKIDELLWQFSRAGEWKMLKECLVDIPFFNAAYKHDKYEIMAIWQKIEDNSNLICTHAYRPILEFHETEPSETFMETHFHLSELFELRGNIEEASKITNTQIDFYQKLGDEDAFFKSLSDKAILLLSRGELNKAMEIYKELELFSIKNGYTKWLTVSLGNQGGIHVQRGLLIEGLECFSDQEQILRNLNDRQNLPSCLINQAQIFAIQEKYEKAMQLNKESEQICREYGCKNELSSTLGAQARIHYKIDEFDKAMELYKEQEQICKELGDKKGLQYSYIGQGELLQKRGKINEALNLFKNCELINRQLGNKIGLESSIFEQALIYSSQGDNDKALEFFKEHAQICQEIGNKNKVSKSFYNQAIILKNQKNFDEAFGLLRRQEEICREFDNKDDLQNCLYNQATILEKQGKLSEALDRFHELEKVCRKTDNKDVLSLSVGWQATILMELREFDKAMIEFKKHEQICRELDDSEGIEFSLQGQAEIYQELKFDEDMIIAKELYDIDSDHEDSSLQKEIQPENSEPRIGVYDDENNMANQHNTGFLIQENNKAVELMHSGQVGEPLEILRKMLFPDDGIIMQEDVPFVIKVNFVTALLLNQRVDAAESILKQESSSSHPKLKELKNIIDKWRAGLSWKQKIGFQKKETRNHTSFYTRRNYLIEG